MLDRPSLNLRVATGLNALSGYLALIAVRGYTPVLILVPLLAIGLMKRGEELHARYPLYRQISFGLTILACFAVMASLAVLSPVGALVALIIYIQCHLLLHRKEERHYYYVYLMTFFLVLAAAVQSPEPVIAVALFLFLVSSAWALSALRITTDPLIAREHAEPEVVRRGRMGMEAEVEARRRPLILLVGSCAACIILLTALFFVITPRVEAGFLGRDTTMIRITGMAQSVDLQGGTYVQQDPTPVMQVELPEEDASKFPQDQMYWRVATLPQYFESSWNRKGLHEHYYEGVEGLYAETVGEFRRAMVTRSQEVARSAMPGESRLVQQRIFSDRMPEEGIPCLDLPLRVQVEGRANDKQIVWDGKNDVTARISRGKDNQLDYTVWSEMLNPTAEMLRETPAKYTMNEDDYALLTNHDLLQGTQALAQRLTAEFDNPYDKAIAIRDYFSGNGYVYTLNLPATPPQHAIDFFINETKRGHCEFYASAMALMLRSLGIPTRVVSGYRGGEWSPSVNAFIVRQSMAHLWVEVYFEGYGWVRFDPAPPSVESGDLSPLAAMVQKLRDLQLRAKLFWFREVISFDRSMQLQRLKAIPQGIFRSFGFGRADEDATTPQQQELTPGGMVGAAASLVILLALAGAGVVLFRRRRDVYPLTREQRQAVRLYNQLRQRLTRAGVTVQGLSAEELQHEVSSRGWAEAPAIEEMLRLYNEVRFGQRPLNQGRMAALLKSLRGLQPARRQPKPARTV